MGTLADVNAAASTITTSTDYPIVANLQIMPMVAAGSYQTVRLKDDSTVITLGLNDFGQCDVGNWTDIVQSPWVTLKRWGSSPMGPWS